jgi:hypothetical protein
MAIACRATVSQVFYLIRSQILFLKPGGTANGLGARFKCTPTQFAETERLA